MSFPFARAVTLATLLATSTAVGCSASGDAVPSDSATAASTATDTAMPATPPTRARLVGIVGAWEDSTAASDSAWIVNGASWSGQTDTADLSRATAQLLGASNERFVANNAGDGAFPIAVAADVPDFTGGTLRVQFNMHGGKSDQNAGILFGLTPTGEYLYARYNTKDGDLALWKFVNGAREIVVHGTGARQLPLNAWHELVVTVRGRELTASITGDTTMRLAHTLDAAPSGRVGVWVKRDAVTSFRHFIAEQ